MAQTRHLIVSGRVQGVGFRDGLRAEALALGVAGWVRNRRDGTVEALIQGEPAALDALVAWAGRGPPAARVAHVAVAPAADDLDRPYAGFDWLPTA